MEEGPKRVAAIITGILVVKHFKEEDFRQNGIGARAQSMIFNAAVWAERIMRHFDGAFDGK